MFAVKKRYKIGLIILGSSTLLIVLSLYLLSLPSIQTRLANQVTKAINVKYKTDFKIDKVAIKLDGRADLKGVHGVDHHGDTLFYANQLTISFKEVKNIIEGDFNLNEIKIDRIRIKIKRYTNEPNDNWFVFIDKLKKEKLENWKPFVFNLKKMVVSKVYLQYEDENDKTVPTVLNFQDLKVNDFFSVNDQIEAEVTDVSIIHLNNDLEIDHLEFDLHHNSCVTDLETLKLSVGQSVFEGRLRLSNEASISGDFHHTMLVGLSIDHAEIYPEILKKLNKHIPSEEPFIIKGEGKGVLNDFLFSDLKIEHPAILFNGNIGFSGYPTFNDFNINTEFDKLKLDVKVITNQFKSQKLGRWRDVLEEMDSLQSEGSVAITPKAVHFDVLSRSLLGTIKAKGSAGIGLFGKSDKHREFDIDFHFDDLIVNKLTKTDKQLKVKGDLRIFGENKEGTDFNLNWKSNHMALKFQEFFLEGLSFEGAYIDKRLKNRLTSSSKFLKLFSDLRFDFSLPTPKYSLTLNVAKVDLNAFGLNLGDGIALAKGNVFANFEGKRLDEFEGTLKFSSLGFTNAIESYDFNSVSLEQKINNGIKELNIFNDDILGGNMKGHYKVIQLKKMFQNSLQEVYTFLPRENIDPNQKFDFNFVIHNKFLKALYPKLEAKSNITLSGNVSSEASKSRIVLNMPLLTIGDIDLQNLRFQLDSKNPIYNSFLTLDKVNHPLYKAKNVNIISTSLRDTLFFRSEFSGGKQFKDSFELNLFHSIDEREVHHFGLKKSKFSGEVDDWIINPLEESGQELTINPKTGEIKITNLYMKSRNRSINTSVYYVNKEKLKINLDAKNIDLKKMLPEIPTLSTSGQANLNLSYVRSPSENTLSLKSKIDTLRVNDELIGNLVVSAKGNTQLNSYTVDLLVNCKDGISLEGSGSVLGTTAPIVDFDLTFNNFGLSFLSPIGGESIADIRGSLSGEVNIWSKAGVFQHRGQLKLKDAGLSIPYLNVDYAWDDASVTLYDQVIDFNTLQIYDSKEQTTGLLRGTLSHQKFKDWALDLFIDSRRILILNKPRDKYADFYGKGYLNGTVNLTGFVNNLNLKMEGSTETGTSIQIPWPEDYGLADVSFINFVDKSKLKGKTKESTTKITEIKGLEMSFELDVNNNAEIGVVTSQDIGSYLKGRGAGSILMKINTNGTFNMWGDFITYDGIYHFKNFGVIDKKFTVKQGGTIVWEGNPSEAQMNIEAVYEVPGGANPSLLVDNPNFNRKIPTNVSIRLQGNLLRPNDPVFKIEFPNASGTLISELNYLLTDQQKSQLQALSLLSQGMFISETSISVRGLTNNIYQKASDIFGELIGGASDKFKVGMNYSQGDRNEPLGITTEDRLGLTLSTKISDRILLNGKIGVPVGGIEQSVIVGDVQIDFLLNEEGSLIAKIFNKENKFRHIGDKLGYTQGVGLSYQVDFNTFKNLIDKIVKSEDNNSKSGF